MVLDSIETIDDWVREAFNNSLKYTYVFDFLEDINPDSLGPFEYVKLTLFYVTVHCLIRRCPEGHIGFKVYEKVVHIGGPMMRCQDIGLIKNDRAVGYRVQVQTDIETGSTTIIEGEK